MDIEARLLEIATSLLRRPESRRGPYIITDQMLKRLIAGLRIQRESLSDLT